MSDANEQPTSPPNAMNAHKLFSAALVALSLAAVACDSPETTHLVAADLIDLEDAARATEEADAEHKPAAAALENAVALSDSIDPSANMTADEWIDYCFGIDTTYAYAGQCSGQSLQFVDSWCIMADPLHPYVGHAFYCNN